MALCFSDVDVFSAAATAAAVAAAVEAAIPNGFRRKTTESSAQLGLKAYNPTEPFKILEEPQIPENDGLHLVRKRRSTDFEDLKLQKVGRGRGSFRQISLGRLPLSGNNRKVSELT